MSSSHPPPVLVVEGEALIAMMIADLLAEAGYRTIWAPDAARAIAAAGDGTPLGAAVVGLRLGDGGDGRDVLRHLRRRRPGLPAVVVAGHDGRSREAELRGLGGPTARLTVPFEWRRLTAILADLLGRPAGFGQPCRRRRLAA